jgi:ribosome maturation factor RimP
LLTFAKDCTEKLRGNRGCSLFLLDKTGMSDIKEKIKNLLEEKFSEETYQSFFLIDIIQSASEQIQVYIDRDAGLQLEHCVDISRFIEKNIEENAWLGDSYSLDVSSPGVGEPLKMIRQYQNNIGRLLSVELVDSHINAQGTLTEVNEEYLVIEYKEKVLAEPGKKKKIEITTQKQIPFNQIKKAVVKIAF